MTNTQRNTLRHSKLVRLSAGLAVALTIGATAPAQALPFTYATFTFEQDNTPDVLGLLGNGATLGGATFSAGTVTEITRSVGFLATAGNENTGFTGQAGFDPSLSLGRQGFAQQGLNQGTPGDNCLFACAINMPDGNGGTTTRHGIEVSWSGGRQLINGLNDDFVIYESASASTSPEGFMVRVQDATGMFSDWRYEIADGFELYNRDPANANGATATAFDLSDFGINVDDAIQSIQIANLDDGDRVDGVDGQGDVDFGGTGFMPLNSFGNTFGSTSFDPDPLYVGILGELTSATVPEPGTAALFGLGLLGLGVMRRRKSA